jgi:glutamate-1-semialdehyde 2,1-aminomutase/spore coat polysaccharide biosynthesis protein SpsF
MKTFERPDFLVSGTFGGDTVSIQAAMATIYALRDNEQHNIKRIWHGGNMIKDGFNELSKNLEINAHCRGFAPRTEFVFETLEHKALFWQECAKKGVLFGYSNFPMSAHTELVTWRVLDIIESSLRYVKEHWANPLAVMEGELPQSPFVRR